VLLAGVAWASAEPLAADVDLIQWDPALRQYVDRQGRARVFHGVNIVYKEWPWYPASGAFDPENSLADEDIDLLAKWGFNVVRLGIMWPGVEPARGNVDVAYLRQISNITQRLGRRGIYTILDLHQDVGSRRFCGEGFPEHYVDELLSDPESEMSKAAPFPVEANASGIPAMEDCLRHEFATYYITERVGALWRQLYQLGTPLSDGFLRFWSSVAGTFANATQVLAYELINEPSGWCLSRPCTPMAPLTPKVEEERLAPLYRAAAARVRAVDAHHIILYEPTVVPKPTAAFNEPPLLENETQQGMAYHIYCQPGDGKGQIQDLVCKVAQDLYSREYYNFLDKYPVAGFMTEFGAIGQSAGELNHLDRLLSYADGRFQSWAYWQLKLFKDFTTANADEPFYDRQGQLEVDKVRALSRTYARAIAGVPVSMSFEPGTGSFELVFRASASIHAPTEVYLNREFNYPKGFSVTVFPQHCLDVQTGTNLVHIFLTADRDASCLEQEVRVRIDAVQPPPSELIV